MPITYYSNVFRHDGELVPAQPPKSGFPLYLYSHAPVEGDPRFERPYKMPGLAAVAVGIAAGGVYLTPHWKASEQLAHTGLLVAFVAATLSGLAALSVRKPAVTTRQLLYFDQDKLIIDNFDGHPEAYEVAHLNVTMANLYQPQQGDDTGDFLCLRYGRKRNYIATFLDPFELLEVKQVMEGALAQFPHYHKKILARKLPPSQRPDPDTLA